ncbi:MAG: penicillin acylase family protein [Saprospiraceae bacterium]|nr:penicillin acylase family protein [Saprospiraceae bacterium]
MRSFLYLFLFLSPVFVYAQSSEKLTIPGLQQPVEIIVDRWGIPHIYAQNEADLFFAQGFYAARDRIFQFELWRRQATGTVAEILGPRELKRDMGARLFQFRGDMKAEMNHYHPNGELIITSFVNGVNAYIEWTEKDPNLLPIEFKLLGIKPQKWTPEVVVSRHQGLLGNINEELQTARSVAKIGVEKVKEYEWFHPGDPDLTIDAKIDTAILSKDILELYFAFRRGITFEPKDLVAEVRNSDVEKYRLLAKEDEAAFQEMLARGAENIGSNNWVVSGARTQSGYPIMANDPHRALAAPSLRYMSHLVAPGWNVIGGGEPTIPGISIGHNEYGAWGLTVFGTDAEDLYIYKINPENPNQYWYHGAWEEMRIIKETIQVKGQSPVTIDLKYTRHGPVVFTDTKTNQTCAVRCGWLEVGGAPYLASLRMDQAKTWEEFREACNYSHIPGENMIWADRQGNIGWQAVGIAPIRRNFSGMVPVPGDGSYEWDGYQEIKERPHLYNPVEGYIATANENVTPPDYPHIQSTVGFSWSEPFRADRVKEVLGSGRIHSVADMAQLQTDYLSIPARTLIPLLRNLKISDNEASEQVRQMLLKWDFQMTKESIEAAIYKAWEGRLYNNVKAQVVPKAHNDLASVPTMRIIEWLIFPDGHFGKNPIQNRNEILTKSLREAVYNLGQKFGKDMNKWQYGQLDYKHVLIKHPLSNAVKEEVRKTLDLGPVPRGGYSFTVNQTGGRDNQTSGATFRMIVDTGDWDQALGTNSPGQGGDPKNPHYRDLFDIWVNDQYFPVFYSRKKVESVKDGVLLLQPK